MEAELEAIILDKLSINPADPNIKHLVAALVEYINNRENG